MVKVEGTLDELRDLFETGFKAVKQVKKTASKTKSVAKKIKRAATPYQKEVGRQLKKLKKKHPRTAIPKLMKRAHAAAKRARK